jgi:hypothetical protein
VRQYMENNDLHEDVLERDVNEQGESIISEEININEQRDNHESEAGGAVTTSIDEGENVTDEIECDDLPPDLMEPNQHDSDDDTVNTETKDPDLIEEEIMNME